MPRRKAEDFICLRTYTIDRHGDLYNHVTRGKMGQARGIFFDDYLSEAQRAWLKTVQHWYIHVDDDWMSPPQIDLLIKRREQERDPDNILLGLLLFS